MPGRCSIAPAIKVSIGIRAVGGETVRGVAGHAAVGILWQPPDTARRQGTNFSLAVALPCEPVTIVPVRRASP